MRMLLAVAIAVLSLAATTKVLKPTPVAIVDDQHGFSLMLPVGWTQVEQDTRQGANEPLVKATSDKHGGWMIVLLEKGPTDEADDDKAGGKVAQANVEKGFSAAASYKRISLTSTRVPAKAGGKPSITSVDLWFSMTRDGKPSVVGARALFFKGYVLTLVVDGGTAKADAETKKLVESFHPVATTPAAPRPATP